MYRRRALILLSLAGCASSGSHEIRYSAEGASECSVQLEPRHGTPAPPTAETQTRPAPQSELVAHAEMPLEPLRKTLEARIEKRLAEGRVRIGPGGTVTYSVDRAPLSLSVSKTALLIEAPVRALAEACRGDSCYASCAPEALVHAEVPLILRSDYRFGKASVGLRFIRGCKVRALGGLLTLDVTPTLEAALSPELDRVARQIDEQLPDIRAEVAKAWAELSTPRELPLGGCFVLQPHGVVQGPFEPSSRVLRATFAVLATPELRTVCGEMPEPKPLPPLQKNLALPAEGVMRLGLVTPLATLVRGFTAAAGVRTSGKTARVAHALVSSRGSDVDAELMLAGDVCGSVGLSASLDFSGDGEHIGLTRAQLSEGDRERVSKSQLDPVGLPQALARAAHVAPLLSVRAFRDAAPGLIAALSPPSVDLSVKLSSARPAGAVARGDQLVAWLEARGALWVKQK